ncbi:MAG TPA: M28 family peptidase [Flavitalea sp.]|nr:M28 family peptidase [Flavitalea sp.]
MTLTSFLLTSSSCLLFLQASSQNIQLNKKTRHALEQVDSNTIKRDITYLADDKLKGRLPGEPGYQMAVDYVVDQFKQIGLSPAGENGSYTQKLILRKATVDNKSAIAVLKDKSGNEDSLVAGKDIFLLPNALQQSVRAEAALVFAGYGLDIPGKYSDYEGLDVKGKIVVVLTGTPGNLALPSTLDAHFANLGSKMNIAASKGATGLLVVQLSSGAAGSNTITVAMNPEKTLAYSRISNSKMLAVGRIPRTVLQRLFMNSGKSLTQAVADLAQAKASSFAFTSSISLQYSNSFNDIESYNIVGKIEGGDDKLKTEYVVHTAHLDHVGVGKIVNGDSIYNGAHDNASGVASLLEIARTYKRMGSKPRRSVLIIMVTAEEMGLLGSAYFAGHPTVPQEQIVADVNTDMPTLIFPLLSISPLGAAHSSLQKNVAFAASELGIEVQEDPMPEEVRFIRSDQYSFVLQGIPSLHVKYGTKASGPSVDVVKLTKEWRDKNYHKPSDEISNGFDYVAARKYVQLNFLISYSIAQTTARPNWNVGDFFELPGTKK